MKAFYPLVALVLDRCAAPPEPQPGSGDAGEHVRYVYDELRERAYSFSGYAARRRTVQLALSRL